MQSLWPLVHYDISLSVFYPDASCWVAGFLPAVVVDGLHRAVWILAPLEVSRVDLLLARVKVDLLDAIPENDRLIQAGR